MTDPILNVAAVSKRFGPTVALDRGDPGGRGCRADGRERRGEVDPREDSQRRLSSRCRRALVARAAVPPNVTTRRQTVGYCDRASIDADAVVPTLSIADNLLLDRVCDPASPWRVPPVVRRQTAAPSSSQVRTVGERHCFLTVCRSLPLPARSVFRSCRAGQVRCARAACRAWGDRAL
jgi:simple sugar transport system ATP-binding protein